MIVIRTRRLRRFCSQQPNIINRLEFDNTCKRRFIYNSSFDGYSGGAGLHDLGPIGSKLKSNILSLWRKHFLQRDDMFEIDTTALTPSEVFKVSGHTQRFTDPVVHDVETLEEFRADSYIEMWCSDQIKNNKSKYNKNQLLELKSLSENSDGYSSEEYVEIILKFGIKSPKGNILSKPKPYNLMFQSSIGSSGGDKCYLRPELAQGIVLNFKRLLEFNGGSMPFAAAAIGSAFRNEISPRNNLLRVREFTLAEIEHFIHPDKDNHIGLESVLHVEVKLWSADAQESKSPPITISIKEALNSNMIVSNTLSYYIARTQQFLVQLIKTNDIRFRQHKKNELAHYASDCWDCEILTSFGWIECVGIADRSCYDLEKHAAHTGSEFTAYERFSSPREVTTVVRDINKKEIGKLFRSSAPLIINHLVELSDEAAISLSKVLISEGKADLEPIHGDVFTLTQTMFNTRSEVKRVEGESYTPKVIEPSFGIGRILYAVLENCYWIRQSDLAINEKRSVLSINPIVAPYKCCILPLSASVMKVCDSYFYFFLKMKSVSKIYKKK